MKSTDRKEKNLYLLLVKNYFVFSLTLLVLLTSIYYLEMIARDRMSGAFQKGKSIWLSEELLAGDYEALSLKKICGVTGYFQIVTADGTQIYSEEAIQSEHYTKSELEKMPEYHTEFSYEKTEYRDDDGKKRILIQKNHCDQETGYLEKLTYAVYDSELKQIPPVEAQMPEKLTERECTFLTGGLHNGYRVYQYPFTDKQGENRILVLHVKELTNQKYQKLKLFQKIFIPIYFLAYLFITAVVTYRLHEKVKTPMDMLEKGITDFTKGKLDTVITYRGPREFETIFSSFNRMARKLQESEKAKEHLIEEKQKMLADISHDLKTPITVIEGYAKAIADDHLTDEQTKKQYLNTIVLKSEALTEMINNFYDYSKLEHPEFRLVRQKQDLAEFLRVYLAEKYDEIELMGFELEVEIPEEVILFSFDQVQLRRVFDNIFNNAIKHNPKGTVIYVTLQQTEKNIRIELGDSGVGIPKEIQADLFEPFTVGDDSRNNKQGSGLGLAVARKITELHGGALTLAETENRGRVSTLFVLNFIK